jgi:hypothetical protein
MSLLTEGTNIRPGDDGETAGPTSTKTDVELACVALFKETPGMVLAMYSAQTSTGW